ncbi:MAG: DNA polymerase III subunit delta' [Rhodobacteraceae bacterium]|nr:DNA polymerase III subunit delta' [Paracoccaceae bacterium]
MTAGEAAPEPDRVAGALHPRETPALYGQAAAEGAFLAALAGGRLHHAWLLTGPRGTGKATLAWRIARHLIALPPEGAGGLFGGAPPSAPATLDIPPDHPVARRMRALAEPRLHLVRRGPNTTGSGLSAVIRVEEVRALADFLHLSAADGGRRAVIIDAADEMHPAAANALLKFLEEPPPGVTFLLVSHQPLSLLPTIRSRCRALRLSPVAPGDAALALAAQGVSPEAAKSVAVLAGGSIGEAVRLAALDGVEAYAALTGLLARAPGIDRAAAIAVAGRAQGRGEGASEETAMIFGLTGLLLARLALAGATGGAGPEAVPGEAALLARLSPDAAAARLWADLAAGLGRRQQRGLAVNLDPAGLLLDTLLRIDETAGRAVRR